MATGPRLRGTRLAIAIGLMLLIPAAVALAATNGTYTGTTGQGNACGKHFKSPCAVRVTIANNVVGKPGTGHSHVAWRAACKSGNFLTGGTWFWGPLKNNSLTVHGHYTEKRLGSGHKGKITAKDNVTVTLHAAGTVTGTVKDSSVVYEGSTAIDHCHTATIKFTARK